MTLPLAGTTTTVTAHVRYFAAAAEAAGVPAEDVPLPAGAGAAQLRAAIVAAHPAVARVLEISSLLVEGVVHEDPPAPLREGAGEVSVDVLPPFAGG
ncbi:MoaD/ThiS family protein [Georgenia sp. AZ-5]|uniref:MoaD/ThiS family protein n=1 Tax=Georgenia sp. AZ-5 TaxID=3367526 RepID=UPI003753F81B